MTNSHILFIISALLLYSCNEQASSKPPEPEQTQVTSDSTTIVDTSKCFPCLGERLQVSGDFNGDGRVDTLFEFLLSSAAGGYINPYRSPVMEYDDCVDWIMKQEPVAELVSSDSSIHTLLISDDPQQFGIWFLNNEGDLDDDGTDELSYVVHFADWSSMNEFHVVSYKNGAWERVLTFSIWDWQTDDLGVGQSLVKKVGPKEVEYYYRGPEADLDTMRVRLPVKGK